MKKQELLTALGKAGAKLCAVYAERREIREQARTAGFLSYGECFVLMAQHANGDASDILVDVGLWLDNEPVYVHVDLDVIPQLELRWDDYSSCTYYLHNVAGRGVFSTTPPNLRDESCY